MITTMRSVLYCQDVWRALSFWQFYFAAKLVDQVPLSDTEKSFVLQLTGGAELALMPKSFLPDEAAKLADTAPALMFFCAPATFTQLHGELPGAGDVNESGDTQAFSFVDPDGHAFVLATRG